MRRGAVAGGALVVIALMLGGAQPVSASCAPPSPIADQAANAVAVVYGIVTAVDGRALTVRVDRLLKGDVRTPLRVFVGPARDSGLGSVATSVDYRATTGSDHVLYLTRGADGELETNECGGSHAGPPTDIETAFFGAGTNATAAPDAAPPWPLAALLVAAVAVVAWWTVRRSRRARLS